MRIHFLNSSAVALELANNEITPRTQAAYFIAGWFFSLIATYSTYVYSNASLTWIGLIEFVVLIFVVAIGFSVAYKNNGGDAGRDFIVRFSCLQLPVGVTTTLCVWGLCFVTGRIYQASFTSFSFESKETADGFLKFAYDTLPYLVVLIFSVINYVVYFWRISRHLSMISKWRNSVPIVPVGT